MNDFLKNNNAQKSLKLSIINYVNANPNQKNTARNKLISNINRVIESARERRLPSSVNGNNMYSGVNNRVNGNTMPSGLNNRVNGNNMYSGVNNRVNGNTTPSGVTPNVQQH